MIVDSHCHILDARLADKAESIVLNLKNDDIAFIIETSASAPESAEAVKFADTHENVYCTIGVHPECAKDYTAEFETWACCVKSRKIVAVGECGLDFHYPDFDKKMQQTVFLRQILLADRLKLPLVVHTRDAFADTLQILAQNKKYLKHGVLFHCFSEGADAVARITGQFDAYFAFGGAVTYKNNKISREAIAAVPLNRLLVETDAPYLSPEPHRGRVNEPKNVKITAGYIAGVLGKNYEDIAKITLENTKRFFRIEF
jgi:TatD DNase family protein